MPDISQDKTVVTTYPPENLYNTWCDHADKLDTSLSQFVIRMVEAGRKQVDIQEATSELFIEDRYLCPDFQHHSYHQIIIDFGKLAPKTTCRKPGSVTDYCHRSTLHCPFTGVADIPNYQRGVQATNA